MAITTKVCIFSLINLIHKCGLLTLSKALDASTAQVYILCPFCLAKLAAWVTTNTAWLQELFVLNPNCFLWSWWPLLISYSNTFSNRFCRQSEIATGLVLFISSFGFFSLLIRLDSLIDICSIFCSISIDNYILYSDETLNREHST